MLAITRFTVGGEERQLFPEQEKEALRRCRPCFLFLKVHILDIPSSDSSWRFSPTLGL